MKNFPIDISEQGGVRYLHFGSTWVQGAMKIRSPYTLVLPYSKDMLYPLTLNDFANTSKHALVIGLGSASLSKYLYRNHPLMRQTIIEICPAVVNVANQFFALPPEDERLVIQIDDGAAYVAQTQEQYDLILVDGFDPDGDMGALANIEFFQNCYERLTAEGYFTMNLHSRTKGYADIQDRIRQAFQQNCVFLPPTGKGNVVVVASRGARLEANE